jgi:predicted alpha/beta-fold hydrolase
VERAVVVCPPVDLLESVRSLARRPMYDRYFAQRLVRGAAENRRRLAEAADVTPAARARSVYEFDQLFTAPVCGYGAAERYYAACSAGPLMARIEVPTLVLASRDDPLVPWGPLSAARVSSAVKVVSPARGGHMGFFGARNGDRDRRWADWRVVEWMLSGAQHP